mmetsp:Transcript_33624/g.69428  ORF Transcript_33624/g.69428 Transcript_33624/m.69428 type:complete len:144 (+) Transcript_33624:279-710(+)
MGRGWIVQLALYSLKAQESPDVPRVGALVLRDGELDHLPLHPTCCRFDHLTIQASKGTFAPLVHVYGFLSIVTSGASSGALCLLGSVGARVRIRRFTGLRSASGWSGGGERLLQGDRGFSRQRRDRCRGSRSSQGGACPLLGQ